MTMKNEICLEEGCDKKAVNRGYCNKHYQRRWKAGLIKRKIKVKRTCKVEGCNRKTEALGYCLKHYKQIRNYGKIVRTRFEPNEIIHYSDCIGILINDSNGNFVAEAFVDKEDLDLVKNYKWHLRGRKNYVASYDKNGKQFYLHRLICPSSDQVDHRDRNTLNNRRYNLRVCDNAQNSWNTGIMKHNSSGVTGVHFSKNRNRWLAVIEVYNKKIYLGYHQNFDDAVEARKRAEQKYFGKFVAHQ